MKYFTINELTRSATAKRMGIDNRPSEEVSRKLTLLVEQVLDPLREAWGQPIIVTSGYRSPRLNQAVGGSATSQHTKGEAADIRTVSDKPEENKKLLDLLFALDLPFDQVINEHPDACGNPNWIHVSYSAIRQRGQVLVAMRVKGKTVYHAVNTQGGKPSDAGGHKLFR